MTSYIITEDDLFFMFKLFPDIEKQIHLRPYNPQAEREKVLDELIQNVSERIQELKKLMPVENDYDRCVKHALLGENQAMWAQLKELRQEGKEKISAKEYCNQLVQKTEKEGWHSDYNPQAELKKVCYDGSECIDGKSDACNICYIPLQKGETVSCKLHPICKFTKSECFTYTPEYQCDFDTRRVWKLRQKENFGIVKKDSKNFNKGQITGGYKKPRQEGKDGE
jgi:hypothetical protein